MTETEIKSDEKVKKLVSGELMGCIVEWAGDYTDIMLCHCTYGTGHECLVKASQWRDSEQVKKIYALVKPSSKKEITNAKVKGCVTVSAFADFHVAFQFCPKTYCKISDGESEDCYSDSKDRPGKTYALVEVWPKK